MDLHESRWRGVTFLTFVLDASSGVRFLRSAEGIRSDGCECSRDVLCGYAVRDRRAATLTPEAPPHDPIETEMTPTVGVAILIVMTRIDGGANPIPRKLAGVDGCRAGWFVALTTEHGESPRLEICPTFRDVLALVGESGIVVVDIPIGLLDERQRGGRQVDVEARKMIGPRRSSVFSPPTRPLLKCENWEVARTCGLSRQSFAILPKIREVDNAMSPELQSRVMESHPEVALGHFAASPMDYWKKDAEGREERLRVLASAASIDALPQFSEIEKMFDEDRRSFLRKDVALDDLVDAYVMLVVAARYATDKAQRIPSSPPTDGRGLRMEMWF